MRKFMIGAAALALATTGAWADPGGKGNGGGKGREAASQGPSAKADKGNSMRDAKADKGPMMHQAKHDNGPSMRDTNAERGPQMRAAKADHGPSMKAQRSEQRAADRDVRLVRDRDVDVRRDVRNNTSWDGRDGDRRMAWSQSRGVIDGCPPGLAKKNNGCLPPGQAKKLDNDYRSASYRPEWFGYDRLADGRYMYDNGYLYRTDPRGSILGYVPLLGGSLSVGNAWPSYYQPVNVPDYYVDYYNLGPANSYRYADDVLYRVDPQTSAITSIAALLTGDQLSVGQPLPAGYDVYNVPYAYQDRYTDGPDAAYRYSDGYVYQVDPTTQLIQAAIQLLT